MYLIRELGLSIGAFMWMGGSNTANNDSAVQVRDRAQEA